MIARRSATLRVVGLAGLVLAGCGLGSAAAAQAASPAPPAPPMSQPLPAQRVVAPRIDRACRGSADCAIKDVGSCCGRRPACVSADATVDPDAVRAQCASDGRAGVCGFRPVTACRCNAGHCEADDATGSNLLRDPAAVPALPHDGVIR